MSVFAKLAGKSHDQVNREIKAKRLLTLSMGNRGQRIPDWQLHPLKHKLVYAILRQTKGVDAWQLYRVLLQPLDMLQGRSAIEAVTAANFHEAVMAVSRVLGGQGRGNSVSRLATCRLAVESL